MKRASTKIKELKKDLHYWQAMYRLESRGIVRTKERIKEIAKEMRKIQKGE